MQKGQPSTHTYLLQASSATYFYLILNVIAHIFFKYAQYLA